MQAITVKFLPPTNFRGARWRARCDAKSITVIPQYKAGPYETARKVAEALANQLGWTGVWYGGSLPSHNSEAFVFVLATVNPRVPLGAKTNLPPAFVVERELE